MKRKVTYHPDVRAHLQRFSADSRSKVKRALADALSSESKTTATAAGSASRIALGALCFTVRLQRFKFTFFALPGEAEALVFYATRAERIVAPETYRAQNNLADLFERKPDVRS